LPYLRLLVASAPAGGHPNRLACEQAFRHVWARGGADPTDVDGVAALAATMNLVRDPNADEVKDELKARTADAIQAGVFGVPSFRLDGGQMFWGRDSFAMLVDEMKKAEAK
jgi:2-hydroxychromene-2-carboxylate isomerase